MIEVYELLEDTPLPSGKFYKKGTKFWINRTVDNIGLFFSELGSKEDAIVLDYPSLYLVFKSCGYIDNSL